MSSRPRIVIQPTKLDKFIDRLALCMLLLLWVVTIYIFLNSPDIVPVHFNASGTPDRYGNKGTLFILPVIATIITAGFSLLNKNPNILNYPVTITANNAEKQYLIGTRMLRYIKLSILLIFILIVIIAHLNTLQLVKGLGPWFLPFVLTVILVPVIVGMRESFKKSSL